MSSQLLISEQQQQMLLTGKEENLIDDNLSYKMMLMMSKMNESVHANSANVLNQYQKNTEQLLVINDNDQYQKRNFTGSSMSSLNNSPNTRNNHNCTPPPTSQQHQARASDTCPAFESHYWRLVFCCWNIRFNHAIRLWGIDRLSRSNVQIIQD